MMEWTDTQPAVQVPDAEYQRLLGYPRQHVLEGRARELADWARDWYRQNGRPWVYTRETNSVSAVEDRVRIGSVEFSSKELHDRVIEAQAHGAALVAASAGSECEAKARQLWEEGKPDEYFFIETFGSAVVENLITSAGARLCAWAEQNGMAVLPHYSPGYSGWDISDQIPLWKLIQPAAQGNLPGALEVLESGMLRPKKSLLAVFGITRHPERLRRFAQLVPCENCSYSPCQYRRAPYRHTRPQLEDVHQFQRGGRERADANIINLTVLNHAAQYSVNIRALEKWSRERLRLEALADGSVKARFRYEGTTCSNLGHPLSYDYLVKLGPAEEGYRVVESNCLPTPGDSGYTNMCTYLNDPDLLMSSVESEKPLLGRPLNEVLTWQRQSRPSGCFCDVESRLHKWGLALEVIHYALVQREKTAGTAEQTA
jgi:hypothetical protein